jgi:hypothetical protein
MEEILTETLYAYPVLFDVYVFLGDPVDSLSAGASTGELVLTPTGRDRGIVAALYRPGTQEELLPSMRYVRLVAMNSLGMTIEGTVTSAERPSASKSKVNHFSVRWVIKHVGAPAVLNAQKLKERSVRRLAVAKASGFDPGDDDRDI